MKAVICTAYGSPDNLRIEEVEKPVPADNEILIKTYATTVTSGDWRVRSLKLPRGFAPFGRLIFGIRKPRQPILGTELSGVVESVGKSVTRFKPGDPVFVFNSTAMGCHAEYKCIRENGAVVIKPENLSFEEAAGLSFGGTTALHFFRKANLKKGETVLINGASGGVGTAAVQIARHFGAEVTGVCSTANLDLVKSLGASHVIDYTKKDFTKNGITYDVIMDAAGTAPFAKSKNSLKKKGRLLLVVGGLTDMIKAPWESITGSRKVIAGPANVRPEDLQYLASLATEGEFKPVTDKVYPLTQIAEAHRHVDTGHKKGNVIVTIDE